MRAARALLVSTATTAIVLTGAGAASAATNGQHPDVSQEARQVPSCGAGFYPWSEYGYCKQIHRLDASTGRASGTEGAGWGVLGLFALVALL